MTLRAYLDDCRGLVEAEIRRIVPADGRRGAALYDLMLDYPLREAKGLRPALCIATCRALGGKLEAVLRSAAVLELYHNAFLIHDDIEDESIMRRGGPTLHRTHGIPVAVNVGDAMRGHPGPAVLAGRPLGNASERRCRNAYPHRARSSPPPSYRATPSDTARALAFSKRAVRSATLAAMTEA